MYVLADKDDRMTRWFGRYKRKKKRYDGKQETKDITGNAYKILTQ